ncbi:carboxyl-terminal processing protease [Janthinobacterium sp. CG_23.3]|uniref:S41 family peptidase n=1 Tax=Janthinobacterium sp. CG_23.3 TaxID=3349634 RepID=UPI0038D491D0
MARRILLFAALALVSAAGHAGTAALEALLWESPAFTTAYRDNISDDEKVAGLSKFWSEVKYNFVFVEKLKTLDWDAQYLAYLPKVRASRSTAEYYQVLAELCATLRDGHTNIMPPGQMWDLYGKPMLETALVEGRVVVTEVFDGALRPRGVLPGVEITTVDGAAVKTYAAQKVAPFESASSAQDLELKTFTASLLRGTAGPAREVGFRAADGRAFTLALAMPTERVRYAAKPAVASFEMRVLAGGVVYVALNDFADATAADGFMAAFAQIARAPALIIDLRRNGGGNGAFGYRVLSTLTDQPFAGSAWSTRQYLPSYRAWGKPMPAFAGGGGSWPADGARHYAGPVVLLSGAATYSAAEDFAVAFDAIGRGAIVGEPTGGSTGQPLIFALPGGGSARVCTKSDTYPDGRAFVGVGVRPHKLVRPLLADLRRGRDTVLEAALRMLAEQGGK